MNQTKSLTVLSLAIALITSCSTGEMKSGDNTTKPQEEETMVGAYTKYRSPSANEKTLFADTYKGDTALTPVRVATQVVAGTNYSFICKDRNGKEYEVIIYEPLPGQGVPEVSSVKAK